MKSTVAIIVLCICAAVVYGIAHDLITARICVEYFTIGHPRIFGTTDPTRLAIGWGVIATWWVGLLLGVPLAIASRAGPMPKFTAARLLRPLLILTACMAACALLAGTMGNIAAKHRWVWLVEPLASRVPPDRHIAFLTDLWAHSASYLAGFLGGLLLCAWVLIRRNRQEKAELRAKLLHPPPLPMATSVQAGN